MPDIHNQGSVGKQINNPIIQGNLVLYGDQTLKRWLSILHPKPKEVYLERTKVLEAIFQCFEEGKRYVVLCGDSGIGKTSLAAFFFQHYKEVYHQVGWIDYKSNLGLSFVNALSTEDFEGKKSEEFYWRLARVEAQKLRNFPTKKLLVINGVDNWEDIQANLDLLDIENTDFLLTAIQPNPQYSFYNFPVPRLQPEEILSVFQNIGNISLQARDVELLRGNLYLLQLLLHQTPRLNAREAKRYLEKILDKSLASLRGEALVFQIAANIFQLHPPDVVEQWVLLQLAALPSGNYEPDALAVYLDIEKAAPDESMDITALRGFQHFASAHSSKSYSESPLDEVLQRLAQKGWLTSQEEGAYFLHAITAQLLTQRTPLSAAYFEEVIHSLELSFFKEEYGLLKDDLQYQLHLEHLLHFLPESTESGYLGILAKWIAFCEDTGAWWKELAYRRKQLQLYTTIIEPNSAKMAILLTDLCRNLQLLGRYEEALATGKRALAIAEQQNEINDSLVSACQSNLASVYRNLGQYERARDLLEKALASAIQNFGEQHPNVARCQSNLANVYRNLGQYERARDLLEKALASAIQNFGEQHPNVARCRSNLGNVYRNLGQYERARDLLEKALASDIQNFGEQHPNVAARRSNLGNVYGNLGQPERARDLLEKALASDIQNFGEQHPNVAHCLNNLANVYGNLGQPERARDLLEKALASDIQNFGEQHPNVAHCLNNLAFVETAFKNWQEAKVLLTQAYQICYDWLGADHPDTKATAENLAYVEEQLGEQSAQ